MGTEELTNRLDEAGVAYELLQHAHTESAAAEARTLGVVLEEVGKTLVLTTPEGYVRAVVSASARLDLRKVRERLGNGKRTHLASEEELARDYPEFELGAVPPLGGARAERVLVDRRLAERESVVVEAGSHEQSIRVRTADLLRLIEAEVADICEEERPEAG